MPVDRLIGELRPQLHRIRRNVHAGPGSAIEERRRPDMVAPFLEGLPMNALPCHRDD